MTEQNGNPGALPAENILSGKRGLVLGVANDSSIAYGCAAAFRAAGADLALTYLNERTRDFTAPLAEALGADIYLPCDVREDGQLEAVFEAIGQRWGGLDFVLHSIAYAPREDLHGRVTDCSRDGFSMAMDVSCHSFIRCARLAEPLMHNGGTLLTVSFFGAEKVVEHYNMMGPVKAALEATVRYLAHELGPSNIRVNAISAGPVMTRAASGLTGFAGLLDATARVAPLRRNVTADEVGRAALLFASDYTGGITGEVLHVDAGVHVESPVAAAEMNSKSENSR